ncbi:AAA family ATPase [Sphingomonas tabacisoli]|uniref:AAA family ATPase n=1 Tax=Sphingomonas tabacisoli TaxID=2249466 RepID=A0ABW4HZP6_9SPHN
MHVYQPVSLPDLLQRDFPPRELLLTPWLPCQGIAMVFAPRGAGKTHFSLGVAYAVACGGIYLTWKAPAPKKVLIIDGEMPGAALQERWASIVQASPIEPPAPDQVRILAADLFRDGLPDLASVEGQKAIEPAIGDADLIVVDNLSTLARSGKENESESWGIMQAWALEMRRKGKTVLFVHHAGKGGEQRGTSKREDVMDSVVKLSLPNDYSPADGARFVVSFTKSRGFSGPAAEAFEASLRDGMWTTRALEDVRTTQILELAAEGLNQRDIAQEVGCSAATVNRVLKRNKGEA